MDFYQLFLESFEGRNVWMCSSIDLFITLHTWNPMLPLRSDPQHTYLLCPSRIGIIYFYLLSNLPHALCIPWLITDSCIQLFKLTIDVVPAFNDGSSGGTRSCFFFWTKEKNIYTFIIVFARILYFLYGERLNLRGEIISILKTRKIYIALHSSNFCNLKI